MADRPDSQPPIQPIEFVPTKGSPVTVGRRDKAERIREAIFDIKLAIDGCMAQPPEQFSDVVASLARHCSLFLRKMVLGDDRSPRLLDDDTCGTAGLSFDRIRKIAGDRRTLTLVPIDISNGYMQLTKLDDETGEPEAMHVLPMGRQRFSIAIEWPLSGMTDWLDEPTAETPWEVRPEGLFESQSSPGLSCDRWLGQQLVLFDNRGITLKDVIRVTVNTEGAHSPPLQRLMLPEGDEDKARFRVVKDREIHILSHIRLCGVRYSHAIVIQAALYLYRELAHNKSIKRPEGDVNMPVFGFLPSDVFSTDQSWLRFDGGLAIAFGGTGRSISHRVRAPG